MAAGIIPPNDAYSYCDVCCINHKQKRKHVYSKKHKERVTAVLTKFAKKIEEVQLFLKNPVIEEGKPEERNSTFWCHFCKNKFSKHVTDNLKTILYGGLLEHLSSDTHCDAIGRFWHTNGVQESSKGTFIIPKVDLVLYKKKLIPLVDEYDRKADAQTKSLALKIRAQEDLRKVALCEELMVNETNVYKTVKNKHNILQNPTGYHEGVRVWKGGIVKYKHNSDQLLSCKYNTKVRTYNVKTDTNIYTTDAHGEGLTSIRLKSNCQQGNIHTGATPPWMYAEKQESIGVSIGPSQLDLDQHIEQVKKSKLNPNRVGTNFSHNVDGKEDSSNWLPSFGRVWNEGARWKSRRQYYKEISGKRKKSS